LLSPSTVTRFASQLLVPTNEVSINFPNHFGRGLSLSARTSAPTSGV
jgi:lysozyme family protein